MDSVRFEAKFRESHIWSVDSQMDMLKNYNYSINKFMKQKSHPSFNWFSRSEIELVPDVLLPVNYKDIFFRFLSRSLSGYLIYFFTV